MKIISLLSLFVLFGSGCAASKPKWHNILWHAENSTNENPEIGALETEELVLNVIVTEFREVVYNPNTQFEREDPTFIAVSVTCRNQTGETLMLDSNPIQVIGPSRMLAKELPLEQVIYKLYGGRLREAVQLGRLAELNKPVPVDSTFPGAVLSGIVAGLRAAESASIVSEMYQRESSQYQLYYHSFDSASLPGGVATSWTQYYPHTVGPIQVMLQGQKVEEGIIFALPPPPVLKGKKSPSLTAKIVFTTFFVGVSLIGLAGLVSLMLS